MSLALRVIKRALSVSAFAAVFLAAPAHSALVTLPGANFDVVYDSSLLGLFGTPALSGNVLFFTPPAFSATSLNGAGTQIQTSTINIDLVGKNGFRFGGLSLVERGDYRLDGAGSSVSVQGQLAAFDLADPFGSYNFSFVQASGSTPLNLNDGTLKPWLAGATLDISRDPLADSGVRRVTIQNVLSATTVPGTNPSAAFVQKKLTGTSVSLEITPVPEPSSFVLLAAGLLLAGSVVRRRA